VAARKRAPKEMDKIIDEVVDSMIKDPRYRQVILNRVSAGMRELLEDKLHEALDQIKKKKR